MRLYTALTPVTTFEASFKEVLPDTFSLLAQANLVAHPLVSRIVLHGSRGLAGGCRPDSDLDLSLIVDLPQNEIDEAQLREVVIVTIDHWQAPIEADLAVIFDIKACKLKCFDRTAWSEDFCPVGGVDCFGLYKIQKGFNGLVTNAGIQVRRMVPCLKIWQRSSE